MSITNIADMIRTAPNGERYIRPYDAAEITGLKIQDTSYLLRTPHYRQYRLVDANNEDVVKTVQTPWIQEESDGVFAGKSYGVFPVPMFRAEDIEKILETKHA